MSEHPIEGLMITAMNSIQDMIDVNTIIGEPIETSNNIVIIPISKVSFGFAAGGSEFKGETIDEYTKREKEEEIQYRLPFGGGSGAGVTINPIAFLVIQSNNVKLMPVNHTSSLDKLLDYMPDLIEKTNSMMNRCIQNKREETQKILKEMQDKHNKSMKKEEEDKKAIESKIEKEMNKRRELFSDFGGNYTDYLKNSQQFLPLIITVLNGYESFVENKGDYLDYYASLLRDGSKYGIIFVMTATAINNVASIIGIHSSRPEKAGALGGPDDLWALDNLKYFVIECKNGVKTGIKEISKSDCSQLLSSIQWFENIYTGNSYNCYPVIIHRAVKFEKHASPDPRIRVMTEELLEKFKSAVRSFAKNITNDKKIAGDPDKLQRLLAHYKLSGEVIIDTYTIKVRRDR